ncbi:esterase/lipase family protein [Desulfosarcina variabilis]|uniref:esterase/lipase family protein n=1 Tax=Desulfosarcina variabilis TaxID=2300 RepID=UPI003AFB4047
MWKHTRPMVMTVAAIALVALIDGCVFRELKNDLAEYEESFALVGEILTPTTDQGKVIVILFSETDGKQIPIRYVFPESTGHFSFLVGPGTYYLRAFEDLNENLDHDCGELAGQYGKPIIVAPPKSNARKPGGRARQNLNIQLSPATQFVDGLDMADDLAITQMPVFKLGTIAKLDAPVFDQANGSTGYWKPLAFIKQFGVGIYFLEPYDPARIPVLFVHGATGTPTGWQDMADSLDKSRYQSWFYYYPSGIRLDVAAEILQGMIQILHDKHQFDRLYITAHSMGGLVSRAAILANRNHAGSAPINLFVSLSTPWGGVRMAQKGAEKAPTAIPSWHDVAPDSEFIRKIFGQSLSPDVAFHLFFSHKGNCSMFMENNDGTVELDSELDYRAQADAVRIYGFNEDHGSILSSLKTIERYREVLKAAQ